MLVSERWGRAISPRHCYRCQRLLPPLTGAARGPAGLFQLRVGFRVRYLSMALCARGELDPVAVGHSGEEIRPRRHIHGASTVTSVSSRVTDVRAVSRRPHQDDRWYGANHRSNETAEPPRITLDDRAQSAFLSMSPAGPSHVEALAAVAGAGNLRVPGQLGGARAREITHPR